jgi:3-phenylpropionate/trans-cinnamate dioxygenase ferredoxin subunit
MEHVVERPKHDGRFDIHDGRPLGAPACVALKACPVKLLDDKVFLGR